jgi:hypothetical protein
MMGKARACGPRLEAWKASRHGKAQCLEAFHAPRPFTHDVQSHGVEDEFRMAVVGRVPRCAKPENQVSRHAVASAVISIGSSANR